MNFLIDLLEKITKLELEKTEHLEELEELRKGTNKNRNSRRQSSPAT